MEDRYPTFEVDFDLIAHKLLLQTSEGGEHGLPKCDREALEPACSAFNSTRPRAPACRLRL